jgi:hypothetical protein
MEEEVLKNKFFIFSDESGSWHDPGDIYVRAWVVVHEKGYEKLIEAISYINSELGCSELKWKTIANNRDYWGFIDKFNFRVFLTISSPADIRWDQKYRVTREFSTQIDTLDFGEIDDTLITVLKKKMFDDVKNVLFLNFYEKTHIKNAKKGIESVLPPTENTLIYRIDPPQMSKDGWKDILRAISPGVQIEFPKSQTDAGIQFADIIAGCIRSFLISDPNFLESAEIFIPRFRKKIIGKSRENPNPNLIFFGEINDNLKTRSGQIWTVGA